MNITSKKLEKLQQDYNNMPHGKACLSAMHSAVRMADELNDPLWRLRTRYDELYEELLYGDPGKVLVLASEFVTIFEENPVRNVLPLYFSVLSAAAGQWGHYPQLPLSQWKELMEHFWKAVQYYQMGKGHYYWQVFYHARREGNREEMKKALQNRLKAFKTDKIKNCAGCNQRLQVDYAIVCEDMKLAEQLAQPILDGTIYCEQEPIATLSGLLGFAMDYETREKAVYWAERLKPHLLEKTKEMEYDEEMLRWLAYKNPEEGMRMMERTMPEYLHKWSQSKRFYFFRASWVLCKHLAEGNVFLTLELPKDFLLWQENGQYKAEELANWFYQQALEIACAFEKRDGFPYYRKKLERADHLSEADTK